MGMVKKSISVTENQEQWVKSQIDSGRFGNESEVFRDLIPWGFIPRPLGRKRVKKQPY